MPIQLAGNIRYGGLFECGFGVTLGELVNDIGGGTLSGRPIRAVQVGGPLGAYFPPCTVRHPVRLRGLRGARRPDRPWRRGGVRRHRRPGAPGPLRHGILRRGILRQMHPVPHRFGARRGDGGQDPGRPECRRQPRTAARPLPHHEVWIVVRAGRVHPVSGAERDELLPGRFPWPRQRMPRPAAAEYEQEDTTARCPWCRRSTTAPPPSRRKRW